MYYMSELWETLYRYIGSNSRTYAPSAYSFPNDSLCGMGRCSVDLFWTWVVLDGVRARFESKYVVDSIGMGWRNFFILRVHS